MKAKDIAKEWLEKIDNDPSKMTGNIAIDVFGQFLNECSDLMKVRNAKSDEACQSCIDETSDKWKAFAKHMNKALGCECIKSDGFKSMVEDHTDLKIK